MRPLAVIIGFVLLLVACTATGAPTASPTGTPTMPPAGTPTVPPAGTPTAGMPSSSATHGPSPSPAAWVPAGAFNDRRVVTQFARIGTGEVLVVGADNGCQVESPGSDTVESGDPWTATWRSIASLPSPRNGPVLVALADGRALVTGGATGEYVAKSSTVVFDPVTRRWSSSGLLNTARIDPGVALLADGRVLAAGGLLVTNAWEPRDLDTTEIWDPTTGIWSRAADLSVTRLGPAAVTLADGRVLVVGGLPTNGADEARPSAEVYDPATGRWTQAGKLTAPPIGLSVVGLSVVALPDGGALAVRRDAGGGLVGERFDAANGTWARTADVGIPTAKGRPTTVAMRDGRVLVVAGTFGAIYDPMTGTWTPTTAIPDGRNDASALLLDDGSVLVGGGWSEWVPDTPSCPTPIQQLWRFVPGTE